MNQVMEFLSENYLYIAGGSLVVIIILILIIVLGNKKRNKKEKESMVNIGDIKTGSIDEVANNMSVSDSQILEPQSISEVTEAIPVADESQNATFVNQNIEIPNEVAPVINEPLPEVTKEEPVRVETSAEEVNVNNEPGEVKPVESTTEAMLESIPSESTEISEQEINIPIIEPIPVEKETSSEESAPVPTFEMPVEEPVKEAEESLEVFGLDDETSKQGSAVAGFSSVNVEK